MKAMGLNGLQTYIAWNLHEPERGVYNWEGMADLERFLDLCKKHDMVVFIRPGPYICGEWELGGIPYWVLSNPDVVIRTSNEIWEQEIESWYNVLLPKLKPYLWKNGGPIALFQIENEYGSYACDKDYLRWLLKLSQSMLGEDDVIYYTTDGAGVGYLKCGTIEEVYSTVDFGPGGDIKEAFKAMREYQPTGPLMNSEYYPGWLSHWHEDWPRVDADSVVRTLKEMVEYNASVNFYMEYGGTNFGFYSGANSGDGVDVQFDTTSYDYDAPISEASDTTYKYFKIRDYLQTVTDKKLPEVPPNTTKAGYGKVEFTKSALLFNNLLNQGRHYVKNDYPLLFEELGLAYGYVLYRTKISGTTSKTLTLKNVHDRAHVYLNGEYKGIFERALVKEQKVELGNNEGVLDILVENQGRINFAHYMTDRKGIEEVYINGEQLSVFEMYTLPMDSLDGLVWENKLVENGPVFYYGTLEVKGTPADTWLDYNGWNKGHIYVNGYNIGRHWSVGPTMTLFIPSQLLKEGTNEIIVYEQEGVKAGSSLVSIDHPIIN